MVWEKKNLIKILRNGFSMLGKKNDGFWFLDVLYKDGFSISLKVKFRERDL